MPHRLFSTKPIGELHEADESGNELKRTLDARALVLLGIGAIIGIGIFVLIGTAARRLSITRALLSSSLS
jgi:amino acid permease